MQTYQVVARRVGPSGSVVRAKAAEVALDTGIAPRDDALNPAELLLASVAACMIKGIERVAPMLKFDLSGLEVTVKAERQDRPPQLTSIEYEIVVDTSEDDHRLELLHSNVRTFGTVYNTLSAGTRLTGQLSRKAVDQHDRSAASPLQS